MSDSLVEAMADAIRSRRAFPKMPDGLTLDQGYAIQKQLVANLAPGGVSGLKAGMTAAAGQQAFGLTHPLIGSLYSAGELTSGAKIPFEDEVKIECEIGVYIDGAGNAISAGPVIELPRPAWATPDDATGGNLTACNIAADRYILGEQHPLRDDYTELKVTLTRDSDVVCEAPLTDALDGPLNALSWMLNEAQTRGLDIHDGMVLITGACGGIHPADKGNYLADYGDLGGIEFTVA